MQRITGAQPALSPLRVRRGRLTVLGRCSYQLAPQLRQWRVVISAEEKPLALLALLQRLVGQLVMVFTGSVRSGCNGRHLLAALTHFSTGGCYAPAVSHA